MNNETKICKICKEHKLFKDFYQSKGTYRKECKKCRIKKNVAYQRANQTWRDRCIDESEKKAYMLDYYAQNKEKFKEYRRRFKEKNPEYYKKYSRERKNGIK